MKSDDGKYLIGLFAGLLFIIGHVVFGYVVPISACAVMFLSYIAVYKIRRTWLIIAWAVVVGISYVITDYLSYTPDGISAIFYKYMLLIASASFNCIMLYAACMLRSREASREVSNTHEQYMSKIKKIKTISTIYGIYSLPVGAVVTFTAMFYTVSKDNVFGIMFINTAIITLIVIAGLHGVLSLHMTQLVKGVEKEDCRANCPEPDNNIDSEISQ